MIPSGDVWILKFLFAVREFHTAFDPGDRFLFM
jgi:hypothetical protein